MLWGHQVAVLSFGIGRVREIGKQILEHMKNGTLLKNGKHYIACFCVHPKTGFDYSFAKVEHPKEIHKK